MRRYANASGLARARRRSPPSRRSAVAAAGRRPRAAAILRVDRVDARLEVGALCARPRGPDVPPRQKASRDTGGRSKTPVNSGPNYPGFPEGSIGTPARLPAPTGPSLDRGRASVRFRGSGRRSAGETLRRALDLGCVKTPQQLL